MYFFQLVILLLSISITCALSTTRTPIIACGSHSQCPGTHFCSMQQRVCVIKRSIAASCTRDIECSNGKCHENICRRSCQADKDCSWTKEYCSNKEFCSTKHCNFCIRNAQCANNQCSFFHCTKSTCLPALAALLRQ